MRVKMCFLAVMAVLVIVPLIGFNWKKESVSPIDNRMLTELDFSVGDKTAQLDSFVKDRIGFRNESINLYTLLNDRLFGEMVHPTYTYGKDGYVFFKLSAQQADEEFIDAFCAYLQKAQEYCESRDIPFFYCINPSKTTVYSRYLPAGYTYRNDFLDSLYRKLEEYEINYISNVELLQKKSQTEQIYNVKYDAGHWNDLGCFYGTNHLLTAVSEIFPAVKPHSPADFIRGIELETSLPVSQFPIQEEVPYFENRSETLVENRAGEYAEIRLNPNFRSFGVHINQNPGSENLPRVLFFHGSYYNGRVRFYDTSFQETYQVHNYQNFIELDYYVNLFQPDCVILESAEYATTRGYFDIGRLREKRLNPAYQEVKDQVCDQISLAELPYEKTEQGGITSLHFQSEENYAFGYLQINGTFFDLEMGDGEITCTISSENANLKNLEKASLILFSDWPSSAQESPALP